MKSLRAVVYSRQEVVMKVDHRARGAWCYAAFAVFGGLLGYAPYFWRE